MFERGVHLSSNLSALTPLFLTSGADAADSISSRGTIAEISLPETGLLALFNALF